MSERSWISDAPHAYQNCLLALCYSPHRHSTMSRSSAFLGFARVEIACLDFRCKPTDTHRTPHPRVSAKLRAVYKTTGCKREREESFIEARVDDDDLPTIQARTTKAVPEDWAMIPVVTGVRLHCLSGLHRVQAAAQYLPANDRWWIVKLYNGKGGLCLGSDGSSSKAGLNKREELDMREQASGESIHTDGEIFYKIRHYHNNGDQENEKKWWARLTPTKSKELKQLLALEGFPHAFDKLLPWPSLWTSVRLGALHRLLTMKCDEVRQILDVLRRYADKTQEVLRGLLHVSTIWEAICEGVSLDHAGNCFDEVSVQAVEALVPQHSLEDRASIERSCSDLNFLPGLTEDARSTVKHNLLSVACPIPTLYTFFEDLKYLEPAAKALRSLLEQDSGQTIGKTLTGCFFAPEHCSVEFAQGDHRAIETGSPQIMYTCGYQQLWLFALRNFPQMTNVTTRKTPSMPKPSIVEPSPNVLRAFASLAHRSGFRTQAIQDCLAQDASKLLARQVLDQSGFSYDNDDALLDRISSLLDEGVIHRGEPQSPAFFDGLKLSLAQRCGRPFQDDHAADRNTMFLPQMYTNPESCGAHITTFYRKWSMFQSFLRSDANIVGTLFQARPVCTAQQRNPAYFSGNTNQQAAQGQEIVALEVAHRQEVAALKAARRQEIIAFEAAAADARKSFDNNKQELESQRVSLGIRVAELEKAGEFLQFENELLSRRLEEVQRQLAGGSHSHNKDRQLAEQASKTEAMLKDKEVEVLSLVKEHEAAQAELHVRIVKLSSECSGIAKDKELLSSEVNLLKELATGLQSRIDQLLIEGTSLLAVKDALSQHRETCLAGMCEESMRHKTSAQQPQGVDISTLQDIGTILRLGKSLDNVPTSHNNVLCVRSTREIGCVTVLTEFLWPQSEADQLIKAFRFCEVPDYEVLLGDEARRFTYTRDASTLRDAWIKCRILWFHRIGSGTISHLQHHRRHVQNLEPGLERKRRRGLYDDIGSASEANKEGLTPFYHDPEQSNLSIAPLFSNVPLEQPAALVLHQRAPSVPYTEESEDL